MTWKMILEIVAVIGGVATLLALLLAPMFYLGAKIDNLRTDMYVEMKDFHGRLERQDAEFKGRLEKQDAEFKGRMEKQDAEFKSGFLLIEERMRK